MAQESIKTTKTFTRDEWAEMTKDDPVLAFIARVNAAALAKPYWSEDFRRAQYDALSEEHNRYVRTKYNSGEPFYISGAERTPQNLKTETWWICRNYTGEPQEVASFDEAMKTIFEGWNIPWCVVDGTKEPFDTSYARVVNYFRK